MPEKPLYDFLIIGQGLAGSLLARRLINAGQRVMVLDDGLKTASSKVAAGLINPLAGMRFNRSPHTEDWLKSAHALYETLAAESGETFFHPIDMQRLFRSAEQLRFYDRQQSRSGSEAYLGEHLTKQQLDEGIRAPHGAFAQHKTGYVELPALLSTLKNWLQSHQAWASAELDPSETEITQDVVSLGGHSAKQLVFCEGYRLRDNPWFNYLPLQPDKGEILRLSSNKPLCKHIINGAHWVIPLAEGGYRFGSTHEHQQIDNQPTDKALQNLQQGMQDLFEDTQDIAIEHRHVGVRPATQDRMPFIGQHPQQNRLWVFNGFGARGALSIPWYAEQFTDHLLKGTAIPPAADIVRYADANQTGH